MNFTNTCWNHVVAETADFFSSQGIPWKGMKKNGKVQNTLSGVNKTWGLYLAHSLAGTDHH